jgi:hypothetical protein
MKGDTSWLVSPTVTRIGFLITKITDEVGKEKKISFWNPRNQTLYEVPRKNSHERKYRMWIEGSDFRRFQRRYCYEFGFYGDEPLVLKYLVQTYKT